MGDVKNVHSGHRNRIKERFCAEGLDFFADHNVLELVLFYSVPRRDTNELAHRLLEHLGSLSAVFEADVGRLMQVPGITYNTAVLIKLFPAVARRYSMSKFETGTVMDNTGIAADYAASLFLGESEEVTYVICLDGKNKVLCCDRFSRGSVNTTEISVRGIVDCVIRHKAVKVILTHNHPSGMARPSYEDIETTRKICSVLSEMNIVVEDHITVGGNGKCASMRELGVLD